MFSSKSMLLLYDIMIVLVMAEPVGIGGKEPQLVQ